jgi:glucose/arabinose dehydrogenase
VAVCLTALRPVAASPQDQQVFTNFENASTTVVTTLTIGESPFTATFVGNAGFRATGALYHSGIKAYWIERGGQVGTITFEMPAEIVEFYARDVGSGGAGRIEALGPTGALLEGIALTPTWREYSLAGLGPIATLHLTNNGTVLSGIDDFGFTPFQQTPSPPPAPIEDPIPDPVVKGEVRIELKPVAVGLTAPVYLTHAPGDPNRVFVVDQVGVVRVIKDGNMLFKPFLDVMARLVVLGFFGTQDESDFDERGLLGLAFHPNYNEPASPGFGKLYTYTSEPVDGPADFTVPLPDGEFFNHQTVITEWTVDLENPDRVDPTSGRELLRIDEPQFNHNAGTVAFGPDAMLYISVGDGGGADDTGPGHGQTGNGQNPANVLGAILRVDVNGSNSANGRYGIPADNPFLGMPDVPDEIYAFGFRNPYRFSFDTETGDLIVADVGQNNVEEIDVVTPGGNYGWNLKEGTFRFLPDSGQVSDDLTGLPEGLIDPVAQYDHDEGISITGGFVYRGTAIPELVGKYVFGDFSGAFFVPSGRLFYADLTTGQINEFILGLDDRELGLFVKGFGQDAAGELYLLAGTNLGPFRSSGQALKITSAACTPGQAHVLPGDVNHDCKVDLLDVEVLLENWLACAPGPGVDCDEF